MRVHRNLNRAAWSLTRRGEPVTHAPAAALAGARFVVSAAGRARVLRERVRAVHAWCDGAAHEADPAEVTAADLAEAGYAEVTYNPYRAGAFTRRDTGAPVTTAALVVFTTCGKCYALNPQ